MSRLGINYFEFLQLTPLELKRAFEDDFENRKYQVESICETLRMSTWHLLNVQLERKNKVRDPKKLWKFPWDKAKPDQTLEEMRMAIRKIAMGSNVRHIKKKENN